MFCRHCNEIFGFCFQRTGNVHLASHLTLEAFAAILGDTRPPGPEGLSTVPGGGAPARRQPLPSGVPGRATGATRPTRGPSTTGPRSAGTRRRSSRRRRSSPAGCTGCYELAQCSDRLGREERRCFLLKFFLCKTFDEISLETAIPPEQVKSFVQSAIKTLREELDQWGGPEAGGLRAGEFQSLMLEVRGCSTLDEALLRGHLLADLPDRGGRARDRACLRLPLLQPVAAAARRNRAGRCDAGPAGRAPGRLSQELAGRLAARERSAGSPSSAPGWTGCSAGSRDPVAGPRARSAVAQLLAIEFRGGQPDGLRRPAARVHLPHEVGRLRRRALLEDKIKDVEPGALLPDR